jgi:hypothetical protein
MTKAVHKIIHKTNNLIYLPILIFLICFSELYGQLLGPGYQTIIKLEYQYSDYIDYTFPDPVLYQYPDVAYRQPRPFILFFPEHRFLTRLTQYFGFKTSLAMRYQWSDLDENIRQKIYNTRLSYELNDEFSVMGGYQYMSLENYVSTLDSYSGHMVEIGGKFNFAGAIHLEPSYAYYTAGYFSPLAEGGGGHSFLFKYRQALTSSTAFQLKYNFLLIDFSTINENQEFNSQTATIWLSQYLPTETAIHLSTRFYWNTVDTKSYAPALEITQYITWNIILHLGYRYYVNNPGTEDFLERIKGLTLTTIAFSGILDYSISVDTKIQLKYRYYVSNQDITMNTYLFSIEQAF